MPKSTGKKGPPLPGTPVRVTAESHSCVAEATATATASQSIGDVDKVVQDQDQSNFEVCPICLEPIVDASDQVEGHDAIFYEGDGCRAWYHRWCAGITKQRYALLSGSDAPFYCPCCVMEQQNNAIIALQDTVKTLTTQLSELQAKCAEQPHSTAEQPSDTTEQPWTVVVKEGKGPRSHVASNNSRGKGKGKGHTISSGGRKKENAPNRSGPTQTGKGNNGNCDTEKECDPIENSSFSDGETSQEGSPIHLQQTREKVLVKGKRRVWGTLKAASAVTVKNTICQLTGSALDKVQVKRKYKKLKGNKIRWWHILSGSESDLEALDKKWEGVKVQTSWKLESCYIDANFLDKGKEPTT